MSTDRALAIAAIRHFLDFSVMELSDRRDFFIMFQAELGAKCRLISPFRAISSAGNECVRAPFVSLALRHDWRTAVHDRGLDMLPSSLIAQSVFILHAEDDHTYRGVTTAKATWTSGIKPVHGWIAWHRDEFEPNCVAAWAISTTESRAIKKLAGWPETLRVHRDDAEAFGGIEL